MFSALYGMLDGTVAGWGLEREMYMISMVNLTYIRCFALLCLTCYVPILFPLLFYFYTTNALITTHHSASPT